MCIDRCLLCNESFDKVKLHAKKMCCKCYYRSRRPEKKEKPDHCIKCSRKWGSTTTKNKTVKKASRGMCKFCYQRYYATTASTTCERCKKDMGKKVRGICSLCRIELESMKAPGRRKLPKIDKIVIDRETKETLRRLFNRYKWGTNTLVDPFIVSSLYLEVFSDENIKGRTASKTEFNLDQFDQENQVIAMLKLLKTVYDKA